MFCSIAIYAMYVYYYKYDKLLPISGCLSEYCSCTTLFIPGDIHVDADGGSSAVCGTCQGVCH